jgi:hypothetical protein
MANAAHPCCCRAGPETDMRRSALLHHASITTMQPAFLSASKGSKAAILKKCPINTTTRYQDLKNIDLNQD